MKGARRVDVAIIGGGSAGLGALREVSRHTQRFVIINDGPWGTMCARVGCMPSKALIEAANAFHRRRDFETFGIRGGDALTIDRAAVLARVRNVRDALVEDALGLTRDLGDRAVSGRARLLDANRIAVGDEIIEAERVVLATGSHPVVPEDWRALGPAILTTDSLFEQKSLPKRIAVVGLGAVGVEMAQALARIGCDVTAFERGARMAGISDVRVHEALHRALASEMSLELGHEVTLARDGDAIRVTWSGRSIVVDRVLVALGRAPSIDDLGLETLGVPLDDHGKPHSDPATTQIGTLPVFLAGDADGDRPRQHEASDTGHIAGHNACAPVTAFRRRIPLSIVFTDPNVAIVGEGWRDDEAKRLAVGEASFDDQGRARLGIRGPGTMRIYADARSGLLEGAEICAPDGEHLAHWLALAMTRGAHAEELLHAPFYHPSLEESLRTALRILAGKDGNGVELALKNSM